MGFTDLSSDSGLAIANFYLSTRSYVTGYAPSQADVTTFKAFSSAPDAAKYPHAARWYKHIASWESEFATLPGDPSKPFTAYGPESSEIPVAAAKAPAADDDDDDMDLFGSDDEEEDAALVAEREKNLAEYRKRKEAKPKPAAKSMVKLDLKPTDDQETTLDEIQKTVLAIQKDGLVWAKDVERIPVAYGIKKLRVTMVIEDEKVSVSDLQEEIEEDLPEHVQSTDIAFMQKL
ncbi:Translation elongation factor 1 beta [Emmonsiellopsis sp. PD_33]|nr:Translation elongation factor 1 beta [Emmonsiellopsis sp. PD_33]